MPESKQIVINSNYHDNTDVIIGMYFQLWDSVNVYNSFNSWGGITNYIRASPVWGKTLRARALDLLEQKLEKGRARINK